MLSCPHSLSASSYGPDLSDSKEQTFSPGSQLYKRMQRSRWGKFSCPLPLQKGLGLALHLQHLQFHFAIKFSRTPILFGLLPVSV